MAIVFATRVTNQDPKTSSLEALKGKREKLKNKFKNFFRINVIKYQFCFSVNTTYNAQTSFANHPPEQLLLGTDCEHGTFLPRSAERQVQDSEKAAAAHIITAVTTTVACVTNHPPFPNRMTTAFH